MDLDTIVAWRATSQHLIGERLSDATSVVRHLLAVQSQDFGPAVWSIAQRGTDLTEQRILPAFDAGEVVRTHVLRPTWHLVAPDDLRWLLWLTAPRVHVANGHRYRALGLDPATLERAGRVIVDALEGVALTRRQLADRLEAHGIATDGQRIAYLLMYAELEQLVCSGPRAGKEHTYQRFEDRIPAATAPFDRDVAVRDLVVRYLTGHGPANDREVARWSSLTLRDVRAGLEAADGMLESFDVDGHTFHAASGAGPVRPPRPWVMLAQAYDELLTSPTSGVALHDRAGRLAGAWPRFNALVLVDGQIAGSWRRSLRRRTVTVEAALYDEPSDAIRAGLDAEAARLAAHHGSDGAAVTLVPA